MPLGEKTGWLRGRFMRKFITARQDKNRQEQGLAGSLHGSLRKLFPLSPRHVIWGNPAQTLPMPALGALV